jgi:hypothetical protein
MQPLEMKIRHTLAIVHAAIRNPDAHPLREANASAAALLEELDPWTLGPDERRDVADLALALRTLHGVLASNDRESSAHEPTRMQRAHDAARLQAHPTFAHD